MPYLSAWIWVLAPNPILAFNFSLVLLHALGGSKWWLRQLGPWQPQGKLRWSSWLPPASFCWRHLESNLEIGFLSLGHPITLSSPLLLSFSHCPSQITKSSSFMFWIAFPSTWVNLLRQKKHPNLLLLNQVTKFTLPPEPPAHWPLMASFSVVLIPRLQLPELCASPA